MWKRRFGNVTTGLLKHFAFCEEAESACKAVCTFPNSGIKRALLWAPEFVVAREK